MSTRLVAFYLLLVAYSEKRAGPYFQHVPSTPLSRELEPIPGIDGTSEQILRGPVKSNTLTQTAPTTELFQHDTLI